LAQVQKRKRRQTRKQQAEAALLQSYDADHQESPLLRFMDEECERFTDGYKAKRAKESGVWNGQGQWAAEEHLTPEEKDMMNRMDLTMSKSARRGPRNPNLFVEKGVVVEEDEG
jgi:hypothetical protein